MTPKQNYKTIIIGAGIAGLTAAYKLHKQGEEFLLIDPADRVGGNWSSRTYKDSIYEFGPNTLMNRCAEINQIIEELGIQDQVLTERFKDSVRYLYLDSRFYEIGSNPLKLLLSGILSPWGIIRAALEPVIASEAKQSPNRITNDESVYSFISRRFGKEIAERLVEHALQGIWAGDIRQLSARVALKKLVEMEEEYGSVIKGFLSERKNSRHCEEDEVRCSNPEKSPLSSISFEKGMQYLTQAIADSLPKESILLGTGVASLQTKVIPSLRGEAEATAQPYTIKLETGEELQTENLIIATKAFQAATLLEETAPNLSNLLNKIYYAPVFLLSFTLPKNLFKNKKPKGFGYISGATEHFVLGTIFSSELYPERNLEDEYLFTCFLGGLKNPQILDFTEGDLILKAIAEQKEVFRNAYGIDLQDSDFNIVDHKLIDKAIPQYNLGFSDLKKAIDKELELYPGLTLLGNYLEGVSIPDTVKMTLGQLDTWSLRNEKTTK